MKSRSSKRGRPFESGIGWARGVIAWWHEHRHRFVAAASSIGKQTTVREPRLLLSEFRRHLEQLPSEASTFRGMRATANSAICSQTAFTRSRVGLLRLLRIAAATVAPRSAVLSAASLNRLLHKSEKTENVLSGFLVWLCRERESTPSILTLLKSTNPILRRQGKTEARRKIQAMLKLTHWTQSKNESSPPWLEGIADSPAEVESEFLTHLAASLLWAAVTLYPKLNKGLSGDFSNLPLDLQLVISSTAGAKADNDQAYLQGGAAFVAFALDQLSEWQFEHHQGAHSKVAAGASTTGATLVIEVPPFTTNARRVRYVLINVRGGGVGSRAVQVTRRQAEVLVDLKRASTKQIQVDNRTISYEGNTPTKSLVARIPELREHLVIETVPGHPNRRMIRARNLDIRHSS